MKRLFFALAVLTLAAPQRAEALCLFCSCAVTADPIAFNPINPLLNQPSYAAGDIDIACTGAAGLFVTNDVALSSGSSGSYASRTMKAGGDALSYNLYRDAGYTQIWGDGTGGSSLAERTFTLGLLGFSYSFTVYGRVPPQPAAKPAPLYADTITVTLTF